MAIAAMEKLDPDGLFRVCSTEGITMCGVLPATAMMASVAARGGSRGELISRATSADSPYGRGSYVVGYAGMVFS
jgi:AmmeMemoRadiSam system protein B